VEIFGPVPARLIDLHDEKIVSPRLGRASARKRFIKAVSAEGRINDVVRPCSGTTAAQT
jgi:hypothetical protein